MSILRLPLLRLAACTLAFALLNGLLAIPAGAVELEACDHPNHRLVLQAAGQSLAARAIWQDERRLKWPGVDNRGSFRLYYSARGRINATPGSKTLGADGFLILDVLTDSPPAALAQRFNYLPDGVQLGIKEADRKRLPALLKLQLVLVQEAPGGAVRSAATPQIAGVLDQLYAAAEAVDDLGVSISGATRFKLWAPTAQQVMLCLYGTSKTAASAINSMQFDAATGIWSASRTGDLTGGYYRYLVDVFVPGVGLVRNAVTDPYSISLNTDSQRAYIARLDAAALKPPGWDQTEAPPRLAQTDMAVYELHVRDFSINDASVKPAWRGKYLAFTESKSHGMQHLAALARAGMTDVHLLPVFDFATLPEAGCVTPAPGGAPDGETQQALITEQRDRDCYNWGYEPYHFNAPEGSYASDAGDGALRILELRRMVQALHRTGLRVGMDVVYNHTAGAGQTPYSVLDRIVPGYYQRYSAAGALETSTCCANTATEHRMMGKLMIDSAVLWAREYHIDSFRFDLMAHQPRAAMEVLQARVNAARGRHVNLLGEGWNFGEVANGARFVQASQLSLNGSGIGTFSDRTRDAVRGGGPSDAGALLISAQGYVNGLVLEPNALARANLPATELMKAADMVRVGLAGSLRDFTMTTYRNTAQKLREIDYNGQPAGYVSSPGEVVNYVENHDNQTLFDNNVYKLPLATSTEDRARVQMLAVATTAFSQGIAYFHAGVDILRSKSLDRDSYNSGDWFNRIDWTYRDNYFGSGMPPKGANAINYSLIKPLLGNPAIKPAPQDIALARDMFRDLLRIRSSSTLFRLPTAALVQQRLRFYNLGATQNPALIVGRLDGVGHAGANFKTLMYFINVANSAQEISIAGEQGRAWLLHPVHTDSKAADHRPAASASYDGATGRFSIPARTALVFVEK